MHLVPRDATGSKGKPAIERGLRGARLEPARPYWRIPLCYRIVLPCFAATRSAAHAGDSTNSADRFAIAADIIIQHWQDY